MNQPSRVRIGNIVSLGVLAATDVGYPETEGCLTEILRSFNYRDILIALAKINLVLQRSHDSSECESILQSHYCSPVLRNEIDRRRLTGHHIFTRAATLRLLSASASVASADATNTPDTQVDVRNKLARCYLIANELLRTEFADSDPNLTEEQRNEFLADLMLSYEYATLRPPSFRSGNFLVRSEKFFHFLEKQASASNIDLNQTFSEATGMTVWDYQCLIWGILDQYLSLSQKEILAGEGLFVEPRSSPVLAPLYEKLLRHTCLSIDDFALKAETTSSLLNEFRLWREYPLLKISKKQIICIDLGFLEDKLETGVFWIIHNQLKNKESSKATRIIDLRGPVFQDYTASVIQRGINAQMPPRMETCIISPKYKQKVEREFIDIVVHGHETLVLLECKAPILTAETKFGGDFREFLKGIQKNALKGIDQLCRAIQTLCHPNAKGNREVEGIDISSVKRIYPVLVLPEPIFSFPLMNRFLNLEFQRLIMGRNDLKKHLHIMSLTVLTIDDLERLESYLCDTPFHEHLNRWITQVFRIYPAFPFSVYFRSLVAGEVRENLYIEQEFKRIHADIMEYFTSRDVE